MTKQEFLNALRQKLSGFPRQDVEERLSFYGEMIDDRIEDGCSEVSAVSDIGSVDEVAAQIIADIPLTRIARERLKPKRRMRAWEIVLLALGSPIWLALAIAAFAVVLSLWVTLWSLIVTLWAVFVSLGACAVGGVVTGGIFALTGNALPGVCTVGAAITCAGLAILFAFACKEATRGAARLTGVILLGIKKCFVRGEIVS